MSSSLVLALAVLAPLAAGCAASPASAPDVETGTLELPLQQPGSDGALYHLAGSFEVVSPAGTQTLDGTGAGASITITLPPGLVTVQLLDGWQLTRSVDGGLTFTPVSALLGSPNPNAARILANQPASIGFQFLVRATTGDLTIGFGVTPAPRELAGGVVVDNDPANATGDYLPYAHARLDFAVFYDLAQVDSVVLPDGTKDRTFTAGAVGVEYFNDALGVLSGTVGPAMAGGFLAYHLAALPDGTQTITGELDGANSPFTVLTFGPHVLPVNVPLDADGFPTDAFVLDSQLPFSMTTSFDDGDATMIGQLRFRSIPN
ncbi:MAG: hypothetical protein ABIY55_29035 [Kofleriaceae bacterium]